MRPASGDLLRVRRGAGPPDRDPMAMPFAKVQRQTVYASIFILSHSQVLLGLLSRARQHGAWVLLQVSLGLGRPVVSRPGPRPPGRGVYVCHYILWMDSHMSVRPICSSL